MCTQIYTVSDTQEPSVKDLRCSQNQTFAVRLASPTHVDKLMSINSCFNFILSKHIWLIYVRSEGRDRTVSIATRYGLDGPGIESRLGQDFPHPSRPALGPT